jgi:predicted amidophosphoribosyltransferase
MHPGRLFNRGFNQTVYLLNKQKEIPIDTKILKKKAWTAQQAGKGRKERIANLKNTFQITKDLSDKKVLLFDDVCTTGQTLSEASRAVKKAGARQIDALVLCRSLNIVKATSNKA